MQHLIKKLKHSLVKKQPESDFIAKNPKLTKIEGYNKRLSFNETFTNISKHLKNEQFRNANSLE